MALIDLGYRVPELLFELVLRIFPMKRTRSRRMYEHCLDLGCGTGLAGKFFRCACTKLTGVDLSEKMIARAADKNIYDALIADDVIRFLEQEKEQYDLLIAADLQLYAVADGMGGHRRGDTASRAVIDTFAATAASAADDAAQVTAADMTFSIGVVPQQSAAKLAAKWVPLSRYLEQKTGIHIVFATAPDIPTFEQRLLEGEYDFLDGTEDYKRRWATGERSLYDVEIFGMTAAARARALAKGAIRLTYDLLFRS